MPKLSMEINESMEMLNEKEYLDKPEKPSSIPKEKPPKKKRVMTEKQLESLAKAREKSALNRRLKKEQKLAEKVALKEEKKLKRNKMPKVEAQHHNEVLEKEDYNKRKDAYDNKIRQEERDRLMGIVEEKRKKKATTAPLMNNEPNWDSCFQPRGRGSDQFF